jgi:radical SAM superfamily enzyme YgiQ (UPF0313 family)
LEFCSKLNQKGIKIHWGCQARATLDFETMVAMKGAGCHLLDVGYESGSEEILKNIKKGITVEQLREFTKNARRAKLKILADFVVGFPGETKNTVETTLQFIKEVKPDLLQIAVATPMPGTEFFRWAKKENYILVNNLKESLDDEGFQKCIISYPSLSKTEIEGFVESALKNYYLNINYVPIIFKNIASKNGFLELKCMMRSAKVFLGYVGRTK